MLQIRIAQTAEGQLPGPGAEPDVFPATLARFGKPAARIAAIAFAVALAGCRHWDIAAPERTTSGQLTVAQPLSTLSLPVRLNTTDLASAIMSEYSSKPLAAGQTGEISAKVLFNQKVTARKVVHILVSPLVPRQCTSSVEQTTISVLEHYPEAYMCWLTPWKWGQCFRDAVRTVTKTVPKTVEKCVEEQAAIYRDELQPIVELKEALLPTSIVVHHEAHLAALQITATGSRVAVAGTINLAAWIDVKQGALGTDFTVKGALRCDGTVAISAAADATVKPDASLDLDLKDFALNWTKACVPGAVESIDLAVLTNPGLLAATRLLGPELKKTILKKLNEKLHDATDDKLKFADRLQKLALQLQAPQKVGSDAWLLARPREIFVSTFLSGGDGAGNELRLNVGLRALPELIVGNRPSDPASADIPFVIDNPAGGFTLAVAGNCSLAVVRQKLEVAISKYLDEKSAAQNVTVDDVDVYQSGAKLVIAIGIATKHGWFGHLGTVYLTAIPALAPDGSEIRFQDVQFDVQTRIVLLKAAAWVLDARIEQKIQDIAHFPISGPIEKARQTLASFSLDLGAGALHGQVGDLSAKGIWIADGEIEALALASGTASLQLSASLIH